MAKVIDLINQRKEEAKGGEVEPFFSFEYFPPRTDEGVANLYKRLERMKKKGKFGSESSSKRVEKFSEWKVCSSGSR